MKTLPLGAYVFTVTCPECDRATTIPAEFSGRLTVDSNGGRLALRMSTKSLEHFCGDQASSTTPLFPVSEDVDAE